MKFGFSNYSGSRFEGSQFRVKTLQIILNFLTIALNLKLYVL